MANVSSGLTICTYNCRSVKSSVSELQSLCSSADLIFLQEHWLLPFELNFLDNIHDDFISVGLSAVDVESDVCVGRPYGGTAILYNRRLSSNITFVDSNNPRITALILSTKLGPTLCVSVYMPTNYGTIECYENYEEICSSITSLYNDNDAIYILIAGDFNCQDNSRFFPLFVDLVKENNLNYTDIARLGGSVYTFCNEDTNSYSWIDHIVASPEIDELVSSCEIKYEFISSDHKPIFVYFRDILNSAAYHSISNHSRNEYIYDWSSIKQNCLVNYQNTINIHLEKVQPPVQLLQREAHIIYDEMKVNYWIDTYYRNIMSCVKYAIENCIPKRKVADSKYNVPGWNEIVSSKHEEARDSYFNWLYSGKKKFGIEFEIMKKTRAQFKLSLRYCRKYELCHKANAYANSLTKKDYSAFWKNITRDNNNRATYHVSHIDGCVGDEAITDRWKTFYETSFNNDPDPVSKAHFESRFSSLTDNCKQAYVSTLDVVNACKGQKLGKSCGPDGIAMEAFINAGHLLHVHLSLLFNLFIDYGYMPDALMQSVLIPILKCKSGNLTSVDNYRAIAISNSVSKIFENVIAKYIYNTSEADRYQFGFKKGHSTGICTYTLKYVVDHYINRGSHVFACFVDFSKAFDRVNHWKLLIKLLDDNIDKNIIRILAFWFSNQLCFVRWRNTISSCFRICNGARQGGVLSPFLFTRYIRDLITQVVDSKIGCCINGHIFNILAYADDIVLLAPSWTALQRLISILNREAISINMVCNASKTVAMVFNPQKTKWIVSKQFPKFNLGDTSIKYVTTVKYLGHIITNTFKDDDDIKREIRNMYVRTNTLIRKFRYCDLHVKRVLFRTYCLCLYDVALWSSYNQISLNKFRSCYNKCIKMFFGYTRRYSLTCTLLETGIVSFDTLMFNCRIIFRNCLLRCANSLVDSLKQTLLQPSYCTQ